VGKKEIRKILKSNGARIKKEREENITKLETELNEMYKQRDNVERIEKVNSDIRNLEECRFFQNGNKE
jgi:hypothetical protein